MSNRPIAPFVPTVDWKRCALYTPGHQPHFIQAKLAWTDDPAKYRTGTLLSVEDDGWITVEVDGEVLRFWNHEPARARIYGPGGHLKTGVELTVKLGHVTAFSNLTPLQHKSRCT